MINLSTKFEVSISTLYKDMKGNYKVAKMGVFWGSYGSLKVTGKSTLRQSATSSY